MITAPLTVKQKIALTNYQESTDDQQYQKDLETAFYQTFGKGLNPKCFEKAIELLEEVNEMMDDAGNYGLHREIKKLLNQVRL